jgi:Lamin Tail Domain
LETIMKIEHSMICLSLLMAVAFRVSSAAEPGSVVISQVYGGGGNAGAPYKDDFVELYNQTGLPIDLSSWTVQYSSATGSVWQVTRLSGPIQPGRYYLVQLGSGGANGVDLPSPDAIGTTNMAAAAGKIIVVDSTTARSGTCPTAGIIDLVGYGPTANCSESHPTASLSSALAAVRSGEVDTDDNAADFVLAAPVPRNSESVPPPVQIVGLAASIVGPGAIRLAWMTIKEVNNLGFSIQRKGPDGMPFADLPDGFVPGQGTTLARHEYAYVDSTVPPGKSTYRLKQLGMDGTVGYSDSISIEMVAASLPHPSFLSFALHPNTPNPFNPETVIRYSMESPQRVVLRVCDMLGREVATLVNERKSAGAHEVTFDGRGLPSGVYFTCLVAGDIVRVRKMMLIR